MATGEGRLAHEDEGVERVRTAHRDEWRATEGFGLTYLPFIARAVIDALRDFPHLNATVDGGELVVHNYVNLSVAVDLDFEGLLAPVVHEADDGAEPAGPLEDLITGETVNGPSMSIPARQTRILVTK